MSASAPARVRRASRALIVDAEQRVLLFRADLPDRDPWWFAPGGALDPGESYEAALVREVMEETALIIDVDALGPAVWTRDHLFTWRDRPERHVERFFLVRITNHDVDTARFETEKPVAANTFRWWRLDEILGSEELFSPVSLGEHLTALLQWGVPDQPVAIGE